jgi:hypothetical protein
MTPQVKKYYIIGGIVALLSFVGFKAFAAKKNTAPKSTKKKGSIVIGELSGEFSLPAKIKTQFGTILRKDSNTKSSILHTYVLPKNLLVSGDKLESDGQWFKVIDGNKEGWVRSDVVDYEKSAYDKEISDKLHDFEAQTGIGGY